jgi:hypothetical protein
MNDSGVTASAVIRFSEELEDASSSFYEALAQRFVAQSGAFGAFASDSRKSRTQVVRTYQETISDALEACYCFEGLSLGDYAPAPALPEQAGLEEAISAAIALEEQAVRFYLDVAQRSQALLATIPRAFRRVAEIRRKRKDALQSMLVQ